MPAKTLVALPGFWGCKEDWNFFSQDRFGVHNFCPIDIFPASFSQFSKKINNEFTHLSHGILMGYSLGARLALHCLIDQPTLWSKAILISAHPGLESQNEKDARNAQDAIWETIFAMESWESIYEKWENQEVFKTAAHRFDRLKQPFKREFLTSCLHHFSLARQENLRQKIAELDLPILWITGSKDKKFSKLAESIVLKNGYSKKIVLNGGHRVPWEDRCSFQKAVYDFVN